MEPLLRKNAATLSVRTRRKKNMLILKGCDFLLQKGLIGGPRNPRKRRSRADCSLRTVNIPTFLCSTVSTFQCSNIPMFEIQMFIAIQFRLVPPAKLFITDAHIRLLVIGYGREGVQRGDFYSTGWGEGDWKGTTGSKK